MTRRSTGRFGPNGMSHTLRKEVGFDGQTKGWLQWGVVDAVHGPLLTNTTLYANASAGATSIETVAKPLVNDFLNLNGNLNDSYQVTGVTGSGAPYTATIKQALAVGVSSSQTVVALPTVDIYLNGSQNMPAPPSGSFLTVGVRFNEGWTPCISDVVAVQRGPAGLVTDRFVLSGVAGLRGFGSGAYVNISGSSGAPPNLPWGIGSLYLDQYASPKRLYVCTASSVQNLAGVVTTPATWHYSSLT